MKQQQQQQQPGSAASSIANSDHTLPRCRTPLWLRAVLRRGRVEEAGVRPLSVDERCSTRFFSIFTVWFSANFNIATVAFGMLRPSLYGLGLVHCVLVILFFGLLSTLAPASLAVFGPKTGLRQMTLARYSFGRYLVSVPVLFNLATLTGFILINCIIGGQCFAAASNSHISPAAGIIISLLSLLVSFAGFQALHSFDRYAFIAAVVGIAITAGLGGVGLANQSQPREPPAARKIADFGMIVASYQLPWASIASDLTTYFDPKVPSWRVFHYTYWGLLLPTVLLMTFGAAIAGAISNNPQWEESYSRFQVGGAFAAMLSTAGGFGQFVVIILSLTLLGNTFGTFYAVTLNFQALAPGLSRVPRYVFSIVITAVVIPVAIAAVGNFFANLQNLMSLIAYWSASFIAVVGTEHIIFRRGLYSSYDHAIWDSAHKLPLGAAALSAGILSFGLVVPCMDQAWWTGPLAQTVGDLGFEVAFALSATLYISLRSLKKRIIGR